MKALGISPLDKDASVAIVEDGEIKGLCARGGFVIDMKWESGKLEVSIYQVQLFEES